MCFLLLIFLSAAFIAPAAAWSGHRAHHQNHHHDVSEMPDYKKYLELHNKDMNRLNDPERIQCYEEAVEYVRNHNSDPQSSFKVHLNKFVDWKQSEIEAMMPGLHLEQEDYESYKTRIEFEMDNEDEDGNENSLLLGLSFGIGAITSLLLSMCGNSRAGYSDYYSYYNSYYGSNNYYYYYGGYSDGYSYGGGNRFWSSGGQEFNWATSANPQGFQVTPNVQDQQQCGSCWAFSTASALVGNVNINSQKKVLDMLSVQELLDCDTEAYSCKGGDPSLAMTFAVKYGLTDAERYPYQNTKKQSCQPAAKSPVASFSSYKVLPSYDEEALETFIEKTPLTVNICASYRTFMYYSSGIYDDSNCCDNGVDHAVLLVGYGTDKKSNQDYWILQNR